MFNLFLRQQFQKEIIFKFDVEVFKNNYSFAFLYSFEFVDET